MQKGFTLIEIIVVIAIIAILSSAILFSVTQYVAKGKDSNIAGNLAVLIPAGEVFYNAAVNGTSQNSYSGFCSSNVITNAISQMPVKSQDICNNKAGLCCFENAGNEYQSWVACTQEFTNNKYAFCVDSRGVKKEICNSRCATGLTQCDGDLSACP